MRDFIVRLDEIDDLLSRLYEFCENHHYFTVKGNLIEVFEKMTEQSAKLVANIKVVAIDEPYDVINDLKN